MKKMKSQMHGNGRTGERGAALIAVLMISFLLMVAVAALLLEASANSSNVTDATAEEQAYYAAESGIQTAINILRNKPVPNPLIVTSASPTATVNQISYLKAARPADSNYPTDTNTVARLSRWMTYDDSYPDGGRVVLGAASDNTGFKVEVINPDNVGGVIAFYTTGDIGGAGTSMTFNGATAADSVTITYNPVLQSSPTTVDVLSGVGSTSLGKFTITGTGAGAPIPQRVRFTINVNLTVPYATGKIIRGYIEPRPNTGTTTPTTGMITPTSLTNVRLMYDSERYVALGTLITLTPPDPAAPANCSPLGVGLPGCSVTVTENPGDPGAPSGPYGTYLSGYRIYPYAPNVSGLPGQDGVGTTKVTATFTAPEPIRLMIRSTGYGPRGSRKVLESVVQKNYFDDLGAPSPLTLIGPPSTSSPGTSFRFAPGNSTPIFYSGRDTLLRAFLPPIGVTNQPNLADVQNTIGSGGFNGSVFGTVENVQSELPNWLQSPKKMDTAIQLLKARAISLGRYVGPAAPDPTSFGDYATGTGITYVDRDVTIQNNTDAGGILIVNGRLTFQGGVHVKGLIIIIGQNGFLRTGGGGATIEGNMIVAPYNAAGISCVANDTTCFMSPQYEINGGGGSTLAYNSNNVTNGLTALTDLVKGVAEK